MMLNKSDFCQLYLDHYFKEGHGSFVLTECQNKTKADTLDKVEVRDCGKYLQIAPNWLKDMADAYAKDSDECLLRLRSECDAIIITERNGNKYIIWIELKSSYGDVFNSAIFQLAGSYVRAKSHFTNFASYNPVEYRELALAVSFPDDVANNQDLKDYKARITRTETNKQKITRIYRLRTNSVDNVFLEGHDFGCETMNLNENINLKSLRFMHVAVKPDAKFFDLGGILDRI